MLNQDTKPAPELLKEKSFSLSGIVDGFYILLVAITTYALIVEAINGFPIGSWTGFYIIPVMFLWLLLSIFWFPFRIRKLHKTGSRILKPIMWTAFVLGLTPIILWLLVVAAPELLGDFVESTI